MKLYLKIVFAVTFLIIISLILTYGKTELGLESDVDTTITDLLPGLVLVTVGLVTTGAIRGIYHLPSIGTIGIGLAVLLEEMYNESLVSTDMLQGLTIGQAQAWCIVLGIIFGGIAAFTGRKYR